MRAQRTYCRSARSEMHMATIKTYPHYALCPFKRLAVVEIFCQLTICLFVFLLYVCGFFKLSGYFVKSFLFSFRCKSLIHLTPFRIFSVTCFGKILRRSSHGVFQQSVPYIRMSSFVVGNRFKRTINMLEALFFCLLCIEIVFCSCHTFGGKSCQQICLSFCLI